MCFQTTAPPSNFDESSFLVLFIEKFLKGGERSGIRTIQSDRF